MTWLHNISQRRLTPCFPSCLQSFPHKTFLGGICVFSMQQAIQVCTNSQYWGNAIDYIYSTMHPALTLNSSSQIKNWLRQILCQLVLTNFRPRASHHSAHLFHHATSSDRIELIWHISWEQYEKLSVNNFRFFICLCMDEIVPG